VNPFCSIFSQLLKLFPRTEFQALVKQHRAERHARGFTSWDQFVAMLFCQLGRAQSLREICGGLASCEGKLSHLGIQPPKRSTLAYANAHRPWELYRAVFEQLLGRCQRAHHGPRKFRFRNKLLSIDATMIDLCARLFDWAKYQRTKGAVKLHLVLDHDGYLPTMVVVTDGLNRELEVARQWQFEPGTIVVMDRGYLDYRWWAELTARGVFFVTRPRSNALYDVVDTRPVAPRSPIVRDQIIRLAGPYAPDRCPHLLRRIEVVRPETGELLTVLTNHLRLAATTIAAVYKDRWQIELFFKAIKQHLRIKTFVGTTPNALKIQIWAALIAMLLIKFLQLQSRYPWSLSNLVALLRMNLFTHRDLWAWIHTPFVPPPQPLPAHVQSALAF
jgi:hypothetical protein